MTESDMHAHMIIGHSVLVVTAVLLLILKELTNNVVSSSHCNCRLSTEGSQQHIPNKTELQITGLA